MAVKHKMVRGKFADEVNLGSEPDLRKPNVSRMDIANAYNWYGYFIGSDTAKDYVLTYLKEINHDKAEVALLSKVKDDALRNVGWNCRILSNGGSIPSEIVSRMFEKISFLCKNVKVVAEVPEENAAPTEIISIRDCIEGRASDLIADLEDEIDKFILAGYSSTFRMSDWLRDKNVKAQVAKKISDYYKPLYSELHDAVEGKYEDLKYGYRHLKKGQLRSYLDFIKSFISDTETRVAVVKVRKARKKKVKPPAVLVSKLNYKASDAAMKLVSVKATDLIGCQQAWVFNTKYRTITVYNAVGPLGLSVKGSTLTGFDEKTSITKTLRKPENHLPKVLEGGKVVLRNIMENINCRPKVGTGRINSDTILLRIIK